MLAFFKILSVQRRTWLFLLFSTLSLETTALYFQYGMGLKPCVMCIYERVALFGIAASAIIGFIHPYSLLLRITALFLGLASAIKGLMISISHVDLQMNPAPWKQCAFFPEFPRMLPLDKWLPAIFSPTGSCNDISWTFLGITMVQWLVFIFACYTLVLALMLFSQLKKTSTYQRSLFR